MLSHCSFFFYDSHQWLIAYMQAMGFNLEHAGLCFGVSHMGMQAILSEEIGIFDQRLFRIFNLNLVELQNGQWIDSAGINCGKDKVDILAFFIGVELYQQGYAYPHLFEERKAPKAQRAQEIMSLVLPLKLKDNVAMAGRFIGVYNLQTLTFYLQCLRNILFANHDYPLALIIGSCNHSMTLGMDKDTKQFFLIDANQLPTQCYADDQMLARKILTALSENAWTVFTTKVYCLNNDKEKIEFLIDQLNHNALFESIHLIAMQHVMLTDSYNTSLFSLAAMEGLTRLMIPLVNIGFDESIRNYLGNSPLYIAAHNGYTDTVECLLKIARNPNQENFSGFTPLDIAIQKGHVEVVRVLLAYHAIPNIQFKCTHQGALIDHLQAIYSNEPLDIIYVNYPFDSFTLVGAEKIAHNKDYAAIVKLLSCVGAFRGLIENNKYVNHVDDSFYDKLKRCCQFCLDLNNEIEQIEVVLDDFYKFTHQCFDFECKNTANSTNQLFLFSSINQNLFTDNNILSKLEFHSGR